MKNSNVDADTHVDLLQEVAHLIKFSIALSLANAGVSQQQIGKKLRLQKSKVNDMLKGVKLPGKSK